MNVERLNKWADYLDLLETQPKTEIDPLTGNPVVFDMNYYYTNDLVKEGSCKTAACALGHAAMMPEFRQAGLQIRNGNVAVLDPDSDNEFSDGYDYGCSAASLFFDIDYDDAANLVYPEEYDEYDHDEEDASRIMPSVVAAKIRKLIASQQ